MSDSDWPTWLNFPPNNTDENNIYTIRASLDGGVTWLNAPTATVTVPWNNPGTTVTGLSPADTAMTQTGGDNNITVTGTQLNLAPADNIRIGAFLPGNTSNIPDVGGVALTAGGTATQRYATLNFPENTAQPNRVYTVRMSLNGGTTYANTPAATVTVPGITGGTGWTWDEPTNMLTFLAGNHTIPHGFVLPSGGTVVLNGNTTINENSPNSAGILSVGDLTIQGTGSLVINKNHLPNRGGDAMIITGGNLTIGSGNITINASSWNALICVWRVWDDDWMYQTGGNVTINGGRIELNDGVEGWYGGIQVDENINITGGEVIVTQNLATDEGDAIVARDVNISGGTVTVKTGRFGFNVFNLNITGGELTVEAATGDGVIARTVNISGSNTVVNATGGVGRGANLGVRGGAGISVSGSGGSERTITIEGNAVVTAQGGPGGAGIGGGFNTANAGGETIIIRGNPTVTAKGGAGAAGIGGASGGAGGVIIISGGTVEATAGDGPGNQSAIGRGNGGADGTVTVTGSWNYSTNTVNSASGAAAGSGAFAWSNNYKYIRLVNTALGGAPVAVTGSLTQDFNSLDAAMTAIGTTAGNYTVTLNTNQTLSLQTIGGDFWTSVNVNITLMGAGQERTIQLDGVGTIFNIGAGGTLTLGNNITLRGTVSGNTAPFVRLLGSLTPGGGGRLYMETGSRITGHNSPDTEDGGTIWVSAEAVFTMNGGTLSGNTACKGGGVHIRPDGTFIMNNGIISGNVTAGDGGGVFVANGGTFTMTGGVIAGTDATGTDGLPNQATDGDALFVASGGTAQHGPTSGPWTDFNSPINFTIEVRESDGALIRPIP
jgi:hypothetical protein